MASAMDKVDESRLRTARTLFGLARTAAQNANPEEAHKYGLQALDELSKILQRGQQVQTPIAEAPKAAGK